MNHLLDQLEEAKRTFGAKEQIRLSKLLKQVSRHRFTDAESLIRFHEALMFILAYPQTEKLLEATKKELASFPKRIEKLEDLTPFGDAEVSGIAGTGLTAMFGYKFALWLSERHKKESEIDWDGYEDKGQMGATLQRFLPLMEEESLVEPHVAFLDYLQRAKPRNETDLSWMMKNFSRLGLSEKEKAEIYESLKLFIHLKPDFESSRTGLRFETTEIFYHTEPLIARRDVSIERELSSPPLKIEKLSAKAGTQILNVIRAASAVRYRELHGFIRADAKSFLKVNLGRGVTVFLNEISHENRLPLRACHSGFMFKNGVPIGYVECLSLFEKTEIGFNLYYTFREGETAWLYAKLLKLFNQHLGVTLFSVDPYQIGHDNEEGIESGAFWFYRKLGFKSVNEDVAKIVEREEKKIAKRKDYRTPAKILRKIAESHLVYESQVPSPKSKVSSLKSQVQNLMIRNLVLVVQEKMSQRFGGNAERMRKETSKQISSILKIEDFRSKAFDDFAVVLSLIPNLSHWNDDEKELIVEIVRSKTSGSEVRYLRLLQKHEKLREAFIRLGLQDWF